MFVSVFHLLATAGNYLEPVGPIAGTERAHLIKVIWVSMIAIGPALLATPLILWRYRRSNARAAYTPKWEGNRLLEIIMWGVPIAVVTWLSLHIWKSTHQLDPYRPLAEEAITVQVVGLDWKWLFLYPDQGVALVDELIVPEGQAVHLILTTDTVMQSLQIPALAGQMYAMPGMTTHQWFFAGLPGETRGFNAQFTGLGFSKQEFVVKTVTQAGFEEAMASMQSAPPLDEATYSKLAERGTPTETKLALGISTDATLRFRLAEPQLFARVLGRYHTGQPLASEAQPGSADYRAEAAALPAAMNTMPMHHHHD